MNSPVCGGEPSAAIKPPPLRLGWRRTKGVATIILIPVLTLAVLLLLLIKFGRRAPAATSAAPPAPEPDAGLHRSYGLPTLPGATDGDFFGTAVPDDEDFREGGGSFGGGGATGDWNDSDGGGSD